MSGPSSKGAGGGLGFLLSLARPYSGHLVLVFLVAQALNGVSVWVFALAAPLMDEGFIGADPDATRRLALAMVGLFLLQGLLDFSAKLYTAWIGGRASRDLRVAVYRRLLATPPHWFLAEGRLGDMLARVGQDAGLIANFLGKQVKNVFVEPTRIVVGLGYLFWVSPRLTFTVLVAAPLVAWAFQAGTKRVRKHFEALRAHHGELVEAQRETLESLDLVHLYGAQEARGAAFDRLARDVFGREIGTARAHIWLIPTTYALAGVALAAVVWMASQELAAGTGLTAGGVVAYLAVLGQMVLNPTKRIGPLAANVQSTAIAGRRVEEVLLGPQVEDTGSGSLAASECRGEVTFEDVSFAYPGGAGVSGVTMRLAPRRRLALAGPSGAGKSTLVALLTRLREPESGSISVDGIPIRELSLAAWRRLVAVVPQDAVLFSTTIRENIALGRPDATDEEVEEAARRAFAHDFVAAMPAGYDTVVGARGATVSGGQRQRIALARAFLLDAPILVLDEPTSHLDAEGRQRVEDAIDRLVADRTVLMVTHDARRLRDADEVVWLEEGRVVERGTPADLLAAGGAFARSASVAGHLRDG